MPDGLNRVEIIGYLQDDPEMRYTANGNAMTTFRVAAPYNITLNDESRAITEWFRCVAWNKVAETAQAHLTKNQRVYVEGRQSTRSWDDQDGQKKYMTELIALQVIPLEKAGDLDAEASYDQETPFDNRAPGLNRVEIIGNVGRDPEMRYTATGRAVTNFSVAVNRTSNVEGERREETEWFRCSAWEKQAELISNYLRKGSKVYLEGRQSTRSWDGQDGQKHYSTDLVVNRVIFLDSARAAGFPDSGYGGGAGVSYGGSEIEPEEIPFEP
jgi:single-strand DNA-binding protein